jgi:lactoylglutathione lyase
MSALEACVRIEHVAIWCKDLESLRAFYERYFGARSNQKYVNETTGFESYFLTFDSGARLELMRLASIPRTAKDPHRQLTGLVHLAISVGSEDRVNQLSDELRKAGHEVLDGPRRTGDGYYECVVLDPEKNRLEITV